MFQLASLDGIHSGVPTRTTSTLTPTTLRNIEEVRNRDHPYLSLCTRFSINFIYYLQTLSLYDLNNEHSTTVPCQAGFVAPLPSFHFEPQHHPHQHHHQHQPMHQQPEAQHQPPLNTQSYSLIDLQQSQNLPHLDPMHQQLAAVHNQSALSTHDENSYGSLGSDSSNSSWTSPTHADDSLSGPNNSSSKCFFFNLYLI